MNDRNTDLKIKAATMLIAATGGASFAFGLHMLLSDDTNTALMAILLAWGASSLSFCGYIENKLTARYLPDLYARRVAERRSRRKNRTRTDRMVDFILIVAFTVVMASSLMVDYWARHKVGEIMDKNTWDVVMFYLPVVVAATLGITLLILHLIAKNNLNRNRKRRITDPFRVKWQTQVFVPITLTVGTLVYIVAVVISKDCIGQEITKDMVEMMVCTSALIPMITITAAVAVFGHIIKSNSEPIASSEDPVLSFGQYLFNKNQ